MSYSNYSNFALSLRTTGATTFTVEVPTSPIGELGPVTVALPASLVRFAGDESLFANSGRLSLLGTELFDCLFPTRIQALYRAALASLPDDAGLRVQLQTDSPRLAAIPWEYAYDSATATWLALDPRTPLVRYYALPFQRNTQPRSAPLNVLVVLSGPSDLQNLDLDSERRHIELAFQPLQQTGRVTIAYLESPATVEHLQASLRGNVDVLHYVGHGTQQGGQGALLLEREDRSTHLVLAEEVAMLVRRSGIRLICLNACLTGTERGSLFSGLGPALVRAEIPAVVAMQYAMPDMSALLFTRTFYTAITDGEPLDSATTAARIALRIQYGPGRPEWGYPVLFMRASDGYLWAKPEEGSSMPTAVTCPSCGRPANANARFCASCGSPLATSESTPESVICPNCGSAARPRSQYCATCGASLKPQASGPEYGVQITDAAKVTGIVTGRDAAITISGGNLVFGHESMPRMASESKDELTDAGHGGTQNG